MSIAEAVLEKLSALPPAKQEKVLEFVEALTVTTQPASAEQPVSALRRFANLNLDGPADSSIRFHEHLYGENARNNQ